MLGNYIRIQPPGSWPLFPFSTALWHLRNGKCDGGIALVWWFPVREKIGSNYLETSESFSTRKLWHLSSHEDLSLEGCGTLNPDLFVFTVGSRERWMAMTSVEQHLQNIHQPDSQQKSRTINKNEALQRRKRVYLKKGCKLWRKTKRKGQVCVDHSEVRDQRPALSLMGQVSLKGHINVSQEDSTITKL